MKLNKLTIHLGKTTVQLIGSYKRVTKNTNITVKYENQILEHIGIHIDSNLTWQDQYNYICKTISQKIGFLKRIRDYVNIDILKMIDNSILLPHIDYGCIIWGRCPNQVNVDRICKLQNRAAQVMLRWKIQDISSNEIFKRMNWIPFQDRVSSSLLDDV